MDDIFRVLPARLSRIKQLLVRVVIWTCVSLNMLKPSILLLF